MLTYERRIIFVFIHAMCIAMPWEKKSTIDNKWSSIGYIIKRVRLLDFYVKLQNTRKKTSCEREMLASSKSGTFQHKKTPHQPNSHPTNQIRNLQQKNLKCKPFKWKQTIKTLQSEFLSIENLTEWKPHGKKTSLIVN